MNETHVMQVLNGLYHLNDYLLNTHNPKNVLCAQVPFYGLVNVLKDDVTVLVSKCAIAKNTHQFENLNFDNSPSPDYLLE
jgi:hypothetical protein